VLSLAKIRGKRWNLPQVRRMSSALDRFSMANSTFLDA